ncbi:GNAT family N-acetyltransferase [Rhodopseudomonas boonkerdii]|uniref:GNAT family N-acetyltransferase n=1 Tax=Rhodopseudomonas boonkerdii TaxID=475937 RepID=UPI001E37CBA1|nr:GNAT family N-acetyltransferase [Rhodopseudomonas boonkerdii]UGV25047.1 GNAT family N-acetyltransferase [Rhodopseudomonas boonkerdii]
MEVQIETTYGATKKFVAAGLGDFNRSHQTVSPLKSFAVTVKEKDVARGGLVTEGVGTWMIVTLLWVEDGYRARGFGSSLLQAAETEARRRGATGLLVDTYSFQAPAFYKKHGYLAYGQVDDFPEPGMTWFRFKKAL